MTDRQTNRQKDRLPGEKTICLPTLKRGDIINKHIVLRRMSHDIKTSELANMKMYLLITFNI